MISRVVYHGLAELELNDAAQHYESKIPGLGDTFLNEIERCVQSITEYPESGTPIFGGLRRRLVARFPYGIIYRIMPDHVRILAIMNLRRRPFYWRDRR